MAVLYYVYLNTMVFAIVSGIVSLVLLLALVYVPAVTKYSILILTVQVGLVLIVVQAMVRIWWYARKSGDKTDTSNRNTLAVGFCPDYMVATAIDTSAGGGTTCANLYSGSNVPIWKGTGVKTDPAAPASVKLALLDVKPVADVCSAADQRNPPASLLSASTASVPWTELRSRCATLSY